ncbi:MAG: M1 family peptidase, partial [Planctomycetes bacterium]|nr:M1 family peptidase [Planctomycetota bacterium]
MGFIAVLGSGLLALVASDPAGVGDAYYPGYGNAGIDVLSYELDLTIEPSANALKGVAAIRMRATSDLSLFHLDLVGLDVDAIEVGGEAATFDRDGRE